MAGVGFLLRLWEKPIWEGVLALPGFDGYGVCLRTASMECAREVRTAQRALFLPD